MKKLTPLEKTLVTVGVVLFLGGVWAVLFPREVVRRVPALSHWGRDRSYLQSLSKRQYRSYGAVSAAVGIALTVVAFYPWKRPH